MEDYETAIQMSQEAFKIWSDVSEILIHLF